MLDFDRGASGGEQERSTSIAALEEAPKCSGMRLPLSRWLGDKGARRMISCKVSAGAFPQQAKCSRLKSKPIRDVAAWSAAQWTASNTSGGKKRAFTALKIGNSLPPVSLRMEAACAGARVRGVGEGGGFSGRETKKGGRGAPLETAE